MNKKGFTLTELMAVLILLAVVTLISTASILSARDKANNSIDKNTKTLITASVKRYLSEREPNATCINIQDLVDEDYLKEPIINDEAKNKQFLDGHVEITVENGEKIYKIVKEAKCA